MGRIYEWKRIEVVSRMKGMRNIRWIEGSDDPDETEVVEGSRAEW